MTIFRTTAVFCFVPVPSPNKTGPTIIEPPHVGHKTEIELKGFPSGVSQQKEFSSRALFFWT